MTLLQSGYRPHQILAASPLPLSSSAPALLHDRPLRDGKTTVYVCEGFVCQNPVTTVPELEKLL
jgi:uncharacterized protein YyaL (SSP411 family)